jgi:hypothetical protein
MTGLASLATFLILAAGSGQSAARGPHTQSPVPAEPCPQARAGKWRGLSTGSFYDDEPAERCAIDQAVANGLLGPGYFRMVDDRTEAARAVADMRKRLRALGIKATFGRCDWVGLVSQGTARGNNSYGAACKLSIDGRPQRHFLICNAELGGVTLVQPDVFAFDRSFIETFIRRACF